MSRLLLCRLNRKLSKSHSLEEGIKKKIIGGYVYNLDCNCLFRTLYLNTVDALLCNTHTASLNIGWFIGREIPHVSLDDLGHYVIDIDRQCEILRSALVQSLYKVDVWHKIIIYYALENSITTYSDIIIPAICQTFKFLKGADTDVKHLIRLMTGTYKLLIKIGFINYEQKTYLYNVIKCKKNRSK